MIARFWWSSSGKDKGIHWKEWRVLTQNKSEGGFGFKDFADMNSALLAKQAWRVIQCPNALWVKTLKAIYHPMEDFMRAKRRRNESWVWTSLLHGRDMVRSFARWSVGSGKKIFIKEDNWLASGHKLQDNIPNNFATVDELIDQGNKRWNVAKIREGFSPNFAKQIVQTPIAWQGGEDSLWWPHSRDGELSVRSSYFQIHKQNQIPNVRASSSQRVDKELWRFMWKIPVPQKIKVFLWKMLNNSLPVCDNLRKRRVLRNGICPLCQMEEETGEHLFLLCDWTRMVWLGNQMQCIPRRENITSIDQWVLDRLGDFQKIPDSKVFAEVSLCCLLWAIWKERNEACFEKRAPNPWSALNRVNLISNDYFSHWANNSHRSNTHRQSQDIGKNWRPPPIGALKMNVDASFNKDKCIAQAGIVIRNEFGELVGGHTCKLAACSPITAEALALREAVTLAANCNMGRVFIESDCQVLVRAFRNEIKIGEISSIIGDLKAVTNEYSDIHITWTPREGNLLAHTVACLGSSFSLPLGWLRDPPPILISIIDKEKRPDLTHRQGDGNAPNGYPDFGPPPCHTISFGDENLGSCDAFPFDPGAVSYASGPSLSRS